MASATYRVGPSDVFSGGDLQADAATLDTQVEALDAQIEGNEAAPIDFVDQWVAWQGTWKTFQAQHFGGVFSSFVSALNDSNRDDLIRYEGQFASFAAQAKSFGANVIAPVTVSGGTHDTLGDLLKNQTSGITSLLPSSTTLVVLAVAAVVVLVVWKTT